MAKDVGATRKDGALYPPLAIASAELDFQTLVEHGVRLPIAFPTRSHLNAWMQEHHLVATRIGRRRPKNVVVVSGKVESPLMGDLYYSQIWVRAGYGAYRKAMKEHVSLMEGDTYTVDSHDVDHAVSEAFIKQHWPEAWINVLFVENGINRSIGAMMEKCLPAPKGEVLPLNIEAVLKIFYRRKTKLSSDGIKGYYVEACQSFLSSPQQGEFRYALNATEILNDIGQEYDINFIARPPLILSLSPSY